MSKKIQSIFLALGVLNLAFAAHAETLQCDKVLETGAYSQLTLEAPLVVEISARSAKISWNYVGTWASGGSFTTSGDRKFSTLPLRANLSRRDNMGLFQKLSTGYEFVLEAYYGPLFESPYGLTTSRYVFDEIESILSFYTTNESYSTDTQDSRPETLEIQLDCKTLN